jgi:hypothetical protein
MLTIGVAFVGGTLWGLKLAHRSREELSVRSAILPLSFYRNWIYALNARNLIPLCLKKDYELTSKFVFVECEA